MVDKFEVTRGNGNVIVTTTFLENGILSKRSVSFVTADAINMSDEKLKEKAEQTYKDFDALRKAQDDVNN